RGSARHPRRPHSPPDLLGDLDYHAELRPLLAFRQCIAFLGRREAALRAQGELLDVDEFRRLLDPPLDRRLALELAGLRGHQPEDYRLAFGHEAQGLEAAGAIAVVFHEI